MTWLLPFAVATLAGTLLLLLVYAHLYVRQREAHLGLWAGAWAARALRLCLEVLILSTAPGFALATLQHSAALVSACLLLRGTQVFLGRSTGRGAPMLALGALGWFVAAWAAGWTGPALTLPVFACLGAMTAWTGVALLRHGDRRALGARLTGWAFIVWGIHIADYPFLRPLIAVAPWGYLLAAVLEFAVAVGMLLVYFQRLEGDLRGSEARARTAEAEASSARRWLDQVVDALAEPLLVIGPDHRVLLRNRAARELGGHPGGGEAPTCYQVSHGLEQPCQGQGQGDECPLPLVRDGGKSVTLTHVHRGRDGAPRHVEVLASPLYAADGTFAGIVQSTRNVTEQVLAYTQLSRAKGEWEATFDAVPDLIFLRDRDHRILRCNRTLADRLGRHPREVVGQHCYELLCGGTAPREACPCDAATATGDRRQARLVDLNLGGDFLVTSSPLPGLEGAPPGAVVVARDVTDLQSAERALAAERNRLAVTLESIADGVVAADAQGRATLINPAALALARLRSDQCLGLPLAELLTFRSPGATPDPVGQALATGRPVTVPRGAWLRAGEGVERLVEASVAPIRDRSGQTIGAVLVFRDVTEAEAVERERARAQHLESLGMLAGGIAHDFNNLLTGIVGNLSLARRDLPAQSRGHRRLQEAEDACFHARDLTQQLLTFARGGEPVKKVFSLANNLETWVSFSLPGSTVRAEFAMEPGLPAVDADEGQIHQVVSNLVLNAQQAMPRGGVLQVRAEAVLLGERSGLPLAPGPYVRVTVADQGVGILPEHLTKIFDPYFTTKQTGSGLGLSTAYSIVRRHGGHIEVRSELGRGSTFAVYLPASPQADPASPATEAAEPRGSGRVLVMDDEKMLRDLLAEMLPELGYEPSFAADGAEAVEAYRRALEAGRPFDCVLLDLTVPGGMGGREALERLRALDPEVRAVASSGYAFEPEGNDPTGIGFVASIPKPYRPGDLARVLRQAIRGPS